MFTLVATAGTAFAALMPLARPGDVYARRYSRDLAARFNAPGSARGCLRSSLQPGPPSPLQCPWLAQGMFTLVATTGTAFAALMPLARPGDAYARRYSRDRLRRFNAPGSPRGCLRSSLLAGTALPALMPLARPGDVYARRYSRDRLRRFIWLAQGMFTLAATAGTSLPASMPLARPGDVYARRCPSPAKIVTIPRASQRFSGAS